MVDGKTAFLGGFNIHRQSSREFYGEKRWRDTHVCLGGSLARHATDYFAAFWQRDLHWEPPESDSSGSLLMPNQTRACMHCTGQLKPDTFFSLFS